MDPPVPIPNTVVKHSQADGTWLETTWESRMLPVNKKWLSFDSHFLLCGFVFCYGSSPAIIGRPGRVTCRWHVTRNKYDWTSDLFRGWKLRTYPRAIRRLVYKSHAKASDKARLEVEAEAIDADRCQLEKSCFLWSGSFLFGLSWVVLFMRFARAMSIY